MLIFILTVSVMALCMLGMAIGVIVRNKTFTSCGNASINYRGERIDCPACEMKPSCDAARDEPGECEKRVSPCADETRTACLR
jgi:hypothetical protein